MKKARIPQTPTDRPGPLLIYDIGGTLVAKRSSPSPNVRHPAAVSEAAWQQIQESLYAALNEGMTEEEMHAQQARNSKDLQRRMALSSERKPSQTKRR